MQPQPPNDKEDQPRNDIEGAASEGDTDDTIVPFADQMSLETVVPDSDVSGEEPLPSSMEMTKAPGSPGDTQVFAFDSGATTDFRVGQTPAENPRTAAAKMVGGYSIKKVLGRGGMGIVYKADHLKLGRTVALKMVLAGSHASPEQLERFITEAKAVAHLQHPNIVQIFEVGEHENLPFFSLEYVDGGSLAKSPDGKLMLPRDAARLMETLCKAMQYAHDHGILHRDLKPANVLTTKEGIPKVTDFGLAKRLEDADDSASTRTGTIMGTPSYMSPEQARGSVHELGPATDQYSLGAMLYEFLTGRPPFLGAKPFETILKVMNEEPIAPRQLQSSLPVDLETICLKALQKEQAKRYASCKEMADDLGRFLRNEPILARPIGGIERAWRWCRRNPLVASLSTAAAVALLAVAVVSTWSSVALSNKNIELSKSNDAVKKANSDLTRTNEELAESDQENRRRSKRLQDYVQHVFREINKLNVTENPRIRDFKDKTLSETLPLIDEIVRELPPEDSQGVATKMSAMFELAKSYKDQGLGTDAERTMNEFILLARERVEFQKGSDASRGNLLLGLRELGQIRSELKRDVLASLDALHEALDLAEQMVSQSKAAPNGLGVFAKYRSELLLADICHQIGVATYRLGDSLAATRQYERSLSIRRKILESMRDGSAFNDPESKKMTDADKKRLANENSLSMSIGRLALASAFNRCGRSQEAEPIIRASLEQTEKKWAAEPDNPTQIRVLIGFLGTWGEFLAWNSRSDEGLVHFKRAAELSDRMLEKNSESAELNRAAGLAFYRYAQWLAEKGTEKSAEWGQKALKLRQSGAALDPKNDRRQIEWMVSLARFGEISEAIKVAERYLSADTRDSEILTEIAQALAQCSSRATGEEKDRLEQQAIKAIQDAISLGFKDAVVLESNIDYKPLRPNSTFQSLIAKLKSAVQLERSMDKKPDA